MRRMYGATAPSLPGSVSDASGRRGSREKVLADLYRCGGACVVAAAPAITNDRRGPPRSRAAAVEQLAQRRGKLAGGGIGREPRDKPAFRPDQRDDGAVRKAVFVRRRAGC